jgi:uncharacterized damage-inducible protein DinB
MTPIQTLQKELDREAAITRKFLERVPADKFEWQPHPKSMSLRALATHVAELPGWVTMTLTTDVLDFATSTYEPTVVHSTPELVAFFEKGLEEAKAQLAKATEKQLAEIWTMRNGEEVYAVNSKAEIIRHTYCQLVQHRAQLGVYFRLLDIPVPRSYGPTADEPEMAIDLEMA